MLVGSISNRINMKRCRAVSYHLWNIEKDKPYINRYGHSYPGLRGLTSLHQEGEELYPLQELITDTGLITSGIFSRVKKNIF